QIETQLVGWQARGAEHCGDLLWCTAEAEHLVVVREFELAVAQCHGLQIADGEAPRDFGVQRSGWSRGGRYGRSCLLGGGLTGSQWNRHGEQQQPFLKMDGRIRHGFSWLLEQCLPIYCFYWLAPWVGIEPTTNGLTVRRSTAELPGNMMGGPPVR